ncbi:helix-turn-helix domain-containing protein [Pseudomonas aeruginosa]
MTPLKRARTRKGLRLADVIDRLRGIGCVIDTGNLSRIENGKQQASTSLAEKLCQVFEGADRTPHPVPRAVHRKAPGEGRCIGKDHEQSTRE